ncbi:type II secretion system F family protein [Neomegalonema sp.]|uniref:type II secretion system F family protein n=1 Tax=Neomegalonema sp. TaxID=2039713 RepID=UPI002605BC7D|nr:type II secretion system F family protein [Neomegalonema sp.]MDD2868838.1 type II secretion system F family protein [Neomegalonema sp.]
MDILTNIIANLPSQHVVYLTGATTFLAVAGLLTALVGMRADGAGTLSRRRLTGGAMTRKSSAASLTASTAADRKKTIQDQIKKSEKRRLTQTSSNNLGVLLERAGVPQSVLGYMGIFVGVALAALAVLILVMKVSPLVSLASLPVTLYFLPRWWLKRMIAKREKKFIEEFPNAIDVLVRGVRTGLPVNDGLKLIGREMQQPVAGEFQRLVDSFTVGVSMEDGLKRMYDRLPLAEVNFFSIVLIIQKQTGGNLAEALTNLSTVLRDRKKLKNKIKALSSEAKASAAIIGSLPFLLGLVLYFMSPEYIALLFTEELGNILLGIGLFWMGLGIFVMQQMIAIDI